MTRLLPYAPSQLPATLLTPPGPGQGPFFFVKRLSPAAYRHVRRRFSGAQHPVPLCPQLLLARSLPVGHQQFPLYAHLDSSSRSMPALNGLLLQIQERSGGLTDSMRPPHTQSSCGPSPLLLPLSLRLQGKRPLPAPYTGPLLLLATPELAHPGPVPPTQEPPPNLGGGASHNPLHGGAISLPPDS